MRADQADAHPEWSAWRIAAFPAFALLGVALPIALLTWIDRYLYYLRPIELIPTYGTAWLLLAAFVIPFSLLCSLFLKLLDRLPSLRRLRSALAILLVGLTAAVVVAALACAVVVWVRTFGLLADDYAEKGLTVFSIFAAAFIVITRPGREALNSIYGVAKYGAALGGLSLACLPFTGWGSAAPPLPTDPPVVTANPHSRPNVLLVTIDALSAQHMSLYGASRSTSPNLETFSRAATTFDHAYANANLTTASISSILTATRPWTHRAFQLPSWPTADARRNSIPALLGQVGYREAYVATNPFAGPAKNGMGSYFDAGAGDRMPLISFCRDRVAVILPYICAAAALPPFIFAEILWGEIQERMVEESSNWHFDPQVASQSALELLTVADKRTPIFLWVHFMPPHSPYAAPEPWLGQFDSSQTARDAAHSDPKVAFLFANISKERAHVLAARYDESIKYIDYYVGEFLTGALKLLGDNTVVILTADHGESFEHGYGMHTGPALFESLIHIPLIIKFPYQTHPLRTSSTAEQVDIGPTLAELVGFKPPSSWEGRSLLGFFDPGARVPSMTDKPAFAMNLEQNPRRSALTTGSIAVIDGRWKLIHYMGVLHYPLMPQLHDEVYDLATDPKELRNLISDRPDEAGRLRKLISTELSVHGGAVR